MSSNEPVLKFNEVGKTYPPQRTPLRQLWSHLRGHRQVDAGGYTALAPISFEVQRGQALGIVGLNGAGKSTLLQLAAGTLTPTQGEVHTNGRIAALLELGSGFNPEATGRENIYLYAATLGMSREQLDQRLDSIIAFSGLDEALDMPVKTYSSGMQVRLAFSVATSVEPDILIVDEALSVGDGVFAKRSFDRVMQLRERGTALLLCSHAMFHVDLFCERTMWLDKGRIRDFGSTAHVLPRYQEFLDSHHHGDVQTALSTPTVSPAPAAQATPSPEPAAPPSPFAQEVQSQTQQTQHAQMPSEQMAHAQAASMSEAPQAPTHSETTFAAERRPAIARLLKAHVRMDGVEGKELQGTSLQSTLEVEVHLQVSQEEPHPRVAMVLSSDSGKILGSSICDADAIASDHPAGHASISFLLPDIAINKGRYRIGIYLMSNDGRYVYEWTDPYAHIELHHAGVHQGAWILPGQWRVASAPSGALNSARVVSPNP